MKNAIAVLLANMGFVLQVSGIFILIPIVASFVFNETSATVALFLAATSFLALGFMTNALCEKQEMTYKQSCTLVFLVFVILGLIGAIPYIYINISNTHLFQLLTDSIFESISGFTTTGFSVISDPSLLPKSIILYRALTQFIGGIGIVLVLLAFFYPEAKLKEFAKSMGLSKGNHKVKKTFLFIITSYCVFTAIMVTIGYLYGYHDLINLGAIIFSAVSSGGFSPIAGVDLNAIISQPPFSFIIPLCMLFAATNLLIIVHLFKKRFKEFFNSETTFFLIIVGISVALLVSFFHLNSYDAGFHVLSALSTTGFSYLPINLLDDSFKLFLIALMFIGGASFSTAGGIKIYRFLLLIKSVSKSVNFTVAGRDTKVKLFGKEYSNSEVIQAAVMAFLMVIIVFASSLIVSYYGFTPVDALFDCTSAMATTGLSSGVVGPGLAIELKWLFMFLMILGRIEVMTFLVIFSRAKQRNHSHREKTVPKNGVTENPSSVPH